MLSNLAEIFQTKRTALIVYDMQVGILSQVNGQESVISNVSTLLKAARMVDMPTFFTRHISLPRNLMGTFQMRQAMTWQRVDDPSKVTPWFLPTSPGTRIIDELKPQENEAVIDKITMSAFEGTYLPFAFRDLDIQSYIICGIAMEIGIEPTVRHGTDLGFIPIVATDACGYGHSEAAQRSIASLAFTGDAELSETAEIVRILGGRP